MTVCTWRRQRVFGAVVDGMMRRSVAGEIAHEEWLRTEAVRPDVVLDAFVVMPDHVHLLFGIAVGANDATVLPVRATRRVAPTDRTVPPRATGPTPGSVGAIIGQYKSAVTKRIRQIDPTVRVWQRGYYDRVVRTDRGADAIRRYVADNPARWATRPARADGHRV